MLAHSMAWDQCPVRDRGPRLELGIPGAGRAFFSYVIRWFMFLGFAHGFGQHFIYSGALEMVGCSWGGPPGISRTTCVGIGHMDMLVLWALLG